MPNINTAQFTLEGAVTKRSLGSRLDDQWLSVMDFGATGNGTTDDTTAIQLAFNTLYGSPGAPQGNAGVLTSKKLYFPAGNYKISQPLTLNHSYGATLTGAGQHQTRLFWSGPEVEGEPDPSDPGTPISSLLEAKAAYHTHIEGMTLDASGVQDCAFRSMRFSAAIPSNGTDGYYRDVHFTNAVTGALFWGVALGSEQLYVCCSFTNCSRNGLGLAQPNALNHSCYNCYFANNAYGYNQSTGGMGVLDNCEFVNNSIMDIIHSQGVIHVENCRSTSVNFAVLCGTLVGCTHDNATPGVFWAATYCPPIGSPYVPATLIGSGGRIVCIGNHATNGVLHALNSDGHASLVGNVFENADYKDAYYTDFGGAIGWEDGAAFS